jgi:hypothetical protein
LRQPDNIFYGVIVVSVLGLLWSIWQSKRKSRGMAA